MHTTHKTQDLLHNTEVEMDATMGKSYFCIETHASLVCAHESLQITGSGYTRASKVKRKHDKNLERTTSCRSHRWTG
jgi:hypothetical protein